VPAGRRPPADTAAGRARAPISATGSPSTTSRSASYPARSRPLLSPRPHAAAASAAVALTPPSTRKASAQVSNAQDARMLTQPTSRESRLDGNPKRKPSATSRYATNERAPQRSGSLRNAAASRAANVRSGLLPPESVDVSWVRSFSGAYGRRSIEPPHRSRERREA
jgi:hypothetical protein